ncbi:MAG: Hsp20/alpha crystallin family protein [Patescibacteria group bacterium]
MAKGKFFGKSADEEELIEEEAEETPTEEEETEEEAGEGQEEEERPKARSNRRPTDDESEDGGEREEWINEYEGQLTLDVYQTKDNVIIRSTIAGVTEEDLDITIANDMVTIKGERKKPEEVRPEDYFYQECYWGPFSRSIILPVDIDVEGVAAELKDGILTVTLPKAAKAKTKKIKVKRPV